MFELRRRRRFPLVLGHSNGFWELCQVHYGSDITVWWRTELHVESFGVELNRLPAEKTRSRRKYFVVTLEKLCIPSYSSKEYCITLPDQAALCLKPVGVGEDDGLTSQPLCFRSDEPTRRR